MSRNDFPFFQGMRNKARVNVSAIVRKSSLEQLQLIRSTLAINEKSGLEGYTRVWSRQNDEKVSGSYHVADIFSLPPDPRLQS